MLTHEEAFTVDRESGEVTTSLMLTCRVDDGFHDSCPLQMSLVVTASDEGYPIQLSSTTEVIIIVHQENINYPVFTNNDPFPMPVSQHIKENDVVRI